MVKLDWEPLVVAAHAAQKNAYAPYSDFKVGAALITANGDIFGGCNVENASYSATVCAERTAIGNALVHGQNNPIAMVVLTDADHPIAPCGTCRQVLAEFCDDIPILLIDGEGRRRLTSLSELLPLQFSGEDFQDA